MATTDCRNIGDVDEEDIYYRYKMPRMVTKVEGKGNGTRNSIVNGEHKTTTLDALLDEFIKKYVMCKHCRKNPETEIVITRAKMVTLWCAACGQVSDVDMRDKFTRFVVNHPPTKEAATEAADKEGEAKEQKKRGKKVGKKKGSSSS
ncbi:hypothetical protein Tsubulata_017373 [Turnera subulata]|uniref:Translation initiation factor IF2/IF5 domain-containing protein n=1 Tax=Turnera subulata TaxID=218843 RepID=A0A9Q0FW35_9ROSI|nr:hypothetical protein Tsubulata_017373 [Turnera subulata]